MLSRDALERHAAGASRYRPRFSGGGVFDNELFTKGFVPLGSAMRAQESSSPTETSSVWVGSSGREGEQAPVQQKRALSDSQIPPTPPSTPDERSAPPVILPQSGESYSKLSLSELADMVVWRRPSTHGPRLQLAHFHTILHHKSEE